MALKTYSKFYYGWVISKDNFYFNFKEGAGPELTAKIKIGSYSSSALANQIKLSLDAAGALTYTVSFNRTTRKFTISTTSAFTILGLTGSNVEQSCLSLLGYNLVDTSSANSHVGNNVSGFEYAPQFKLQSYISTEHLRRASDSSLNVSTSGKIEFVSFGTEKRMECDLMFITDIFQSGAIRNDPSGVTNYLNFIRFATTKAPIEFMESESAVDTYEVFVLESTEEDKNGTGYRLIEEYGKGLAGYFRSGKLVFFKITE
jgi:hypothetical protein